MVKLQTLVKSRRFWVAVAGVVAVTSDALGLGLSEEMVTNFFWVQRGLSVKVCVHLRHRFYNATFW